MHIGKEARSELSRERMFELGTVMYHKSGVLGPTGQGAVKMNRRKRDRRKTRP
jgi:hypothetical protein